MKLNRAERRAANVAAHAAKRQAEAEARALKRINERAARIEAWRAAQPSRERNGLHAVQAPAVAAPTALPVRAKRAPSAARRAGGLRAAEKRAESNDAVRANIPAELLPAFEKWKHTGKATERTTRTEAFLQWVHDHGGDALRLYWEACESSAALTPEESEADYLARHCAA